MKVPLSRPDVGEREIGSVLETLRTPHLSLGPRLDEFERKFAAYIGTEHAVAVSSGTAALHLLMEGFGIREGDEVITTPFSFIASSNCILFQRALPVFADIDPETLNLEAEAIESRITSRTRAILVVHVFGLPADMKRINGIARKHRLIVIEDACEALGAEIGGVKAGNFSAAATFAFYPNKQITTGEGGMIVTDDRRLRDLCRSLRNQGREMKAGEAVFARLGYNYRLSEISCALGIAQLKRAEQILRRRARAARKYHAALGEFDELELLPFAAGDRTRSWFVYVVKLQDRFGKGARDALVSLLARRGIQCGKYFPAIHLSPFYRKRFGFRRGIFPITERTADRTFALPFFTVIKEEEIAYVCRELKKALRQLRK